MGIETIAEVEESTEPPLCASIVPTSHSSTTDAQLETRANDLNTEDRLTETGQGQPFTPTKNPENVSHDFHCLDPARISVLLKTDLQNGLSGSEAHLRLGRDGPNTVHEIKGVSPWGILLRQVSNSLTIVLLITMGLSFGIDDYIEGGVITAVIVLNIVVGFFQDYRAEKTILSLHRLSAPVCRVIRDGQVASVKAESLVVGDVVRLTVGDIVPADLRLFEGMNISMEEALLTGESMPIAKNPHQTLNFPDIPIGDRVNMAYSGCSTTQGRAIGVVVTTGMNTEVGKIAQLLRERKESNSTSTVSLSLRRATSTMKNILGLVGTPLQVKLSKFALLLFALAILLAIIVFSVNLWDVQGEVLIYGIAVAVAVIPESLVAVLTITIAVGTKAMAKGNVVVRRLQCLEAVGGVTNICSDKTGTLTQGRMIARSAWIPHAGDLNICHTSDPYDPTSGTVHLNETNWDGSAPEEINPALDTFLSAISTCNLSSVHHDGKIWTAVGEPTEIALHVLAMRFDYDKTKVISTHNLRLRTEYPFDSAIKKMTAVYENPQQNINQVYTKGAPEAVIPHLSIKSEEESRIRKRADKMAEEGLRVLCIASKQTSMDEDGEIFPRSAAESNLQFGGLIGLYDPPRVETAGAVRKCQMAGITVHMLTGDHIKTATAIASEVGILDHTAANINPKRHILAADEFDKMTDFEIDALEQLPLVIARCSPATKVRVVEAMHRRQYFCVMTGDGVNDSPALKRADVGIAMGKNGSDVAKEAADMVLTDDNFSSIVRAVEEGRRLFDNIQKFLMHLLISNIAQVILLLIALAFKDTGGDSVFPLSPLEILWANLVTSSFLAVGLGLEEAQLDIMLRPPHDLRVGVFTRELIVDKMIYGTFMGSFCLVAFVCVVYAAGSGVTDLGDGCNEGFNSSCDTVFRARATTFATLTFLLLLTAWEVKHFSRSLFRMDPMSSQGPLSIFPTIWQNRFLFWAVVAGFVIAFPIVYLPVVNELVFKHHAISWEWGIVFGCTAAYLACVETWKAIKRTLRIGSGRHGIVSLEDGRGSIALGTPSLLSLSANTSIVEK